MRFGLSGATAIVVLTLVMVEARPARGCGSGVGGDLVLMGAAVLAGGAANITLTGFDIASARTDTALPRLYGAVELLLTTSQVALYTWLAVTPTDAGLQIDPGLAILLSVWPAALAAHGVYTVFRPRPEPALRTAATFHPSPKTAVEWQLTPAFVGAGDARAAPGAAFSGRF